MHPRRARSPTNALRRPASTGRGFDPRPRRIVEALGQRRALRGSAAAVPCFVAPSITVETCGLRRHQATASGAGAHAEFCGAARRTCAHVRRAAPPDRPATHRAATRSPPAPAAHPPARRRCTCRSAGPRPAATRSSVPRPYSEYSGAYSSSTRSRCSRLYCGCSIVGACRWCARATLCASRIALRRPFRRAPVQHLALADQRVHRPHGFRDRRVGIGAVAEIQVEVIHAQALERGVAGVVTCLRDRPFCVGRGSRRRRRSPCSTRTSCRAAGAGRRSRRP